MQFRSLIIKTGATKVHCSHLCGSNTVLSAYTCSTHVHGMHAYIYTQMHMHICTHTYMYIHTYTHIHTAVGVQMLVAAFV